MHLIVFGPEKQLWQRIKQNNNNEKNNKKRQRPSKPFRSAFFNARKPRLTHTNHLVSFLRFERGCYQ